MILESTLVGYADNSTLIAEVPKPGNRVSTSSINRDLGRIGDWRKCWGMLVTPITIKA